MTKKIYIAGPLLNTHEKDYLKKIAREVLDLEIQALKKLKTELEEEIIQIKIEEKVMH